MKAAGTQLVHATAVALDGVAVLLRGPSGSGKSDLALRLIDGGAALIADDQTELMREAPGLIAGLPRNAPADLRGRIEVRGVGILAVPFVAQAPLALVAELAPDHPIERLPQPAAAAYLGVSVPLIALRPFEASAVSKLRFAVRGLGALAETPA